MKIRRTVSILALLGSLFLAAPVLALVCPPPVTPARMVGGYIPTATDWNTAIVDAYKYVNNNIVAALNVMTAKGDLYVYDGGNLRAQIVGANDEVLIANDGVATGIRWGTTTGLNTLTTKGDLEVHDGTTIQRLPIGTDGYVLGADSTQSLGVGWISLANDAAFPKGAIVAWSPTFAATGVPSGYLVCDGTSGTPNLIGRFIIGTRPNGSSATPSSGGWGIKTVDATSGASGHTHTFSLSGTPNNTTSSEVGTVEVATGTGATIATGGHTHTITNQSSPGSGSNRPADYAVIYLMKQ